MPTPLRWILYSLAALLGLGLLAGAVVGLMIIFAYPKLPSVDALADYQPKIPLRVYTADGHLIGEFGQERRLFVRIEDVPEQVRQAIIAAEDERFYQHRGVDTLGVLRAAYANFLSGTRRQGASTITMQVARNFFLTRERTLSRKLYEALLAFKIENSLSKDQILELYVNQIFLGQRAYGFAAAAQTYYGKPLKNLNLAEAAMLAGLPKAPSSYNPVANFARAHQRQLYVVRRMRELGFISEEQAAQAQAQKPTIRREPSEALTSAEYVAEMARQIAYDQFRDATYSIGLNIVTTVTLKDQEAAYRSLRRGVMNFDRRHGYRGPEGYEDMARRDGDDAIEDLLQEYPDHDDMKAALVLEATVRQVRVLLHGGEVLAIEGEGLRFAARMLGEKAPANRRIRPGAVVRVAKDERGRWEITQMPEVESAFVGLDPQTGAIRALVGGFAYDRNKFNHATQAWRQPGSSFKPFIYSAALEKDFAPATMVDDAPFSVSAAETGSQAWEPRNYDEKYDGPMPMRTALAKSKNMVSIRILQSIGPRYAQDYVSRFGFEAARHPAYLTLALGAGATTPWQMAGAYAVFANGGYRVQPYIVQRIVDDKGKVLAQADPVPAGTPTQLVIDPRNAYIMDSMMRDVVRYGTATRALSLKRSDIAGKTGTTNDFVDAWFCGYQASLVGVAWMGYDQPRRLGDKETGGAAALPIWIGFMEKALRGVPEARRDMPEGLVAALNPESGRSDLYYREKTPPPPPPAEPFDFHPASPPPPLTPGPAPTPAATPDLRG